MHRKEELKIEFESYYTVYSAAVSFIVLFSLFFCGYFMSLVSLHKILLEEVL